MRSASCLGEAAFDAERQGAVRPDESASVRRAQRAPRGLIVVAASWTMKWSPPGEEVARRR